MSVPSHFGRYRVLRPLATGEMGVVYLAEDPLIGRQVAIKGIRFDPCSDDEEIKRLQQRFEQEIQIAGTFSHPNIVTLFDVGWQGGRSFIAMEYVDGRSLRAELQANGPMSAEHAVKLTVPLCRALQYAHDRGVVHRDIKPTNILVSSEGIPKITDFGVARLFGSTLTHAGKIFGTPAYMSPEQAVGGKLTGASDQFALAAVLYELVTGERPFKGGSPTAVIYEVIERDPLPPHEIAPLVPTAVSAAIMRGLAKDPGERFASCDELADSLRDALAWSKANPELAYLGEATREAEPEAAPEMSTWHVDWERLRQRAGGVMATITDRDLWARLRANAGRVAEHPRRLATVAVATAGVAGLITAVTWAAVIGATEHRTASADADVLATPGPVAGALPDSERGVSRGSESHDLDAGAAPAAAPPGHTVADDDPEAAAVTPRTFVVVSRPVGATVSLNGEHLGESSPVSIEVLPGERYTLRLEKSGFEPLSWAFSLEELSASHRQSGELYFPLQPSPQPGDEEELDVAPGVALARVMPTATESAATSSEPTDPFGFPGGPPPSPTNIRRVRAPAEAPAPEKLHHVEPTLPANVTVAGVVVLEIEVSARGNVVQAKVLRSLDPLADRAALDAVVRWKYRPTQLSGTPVHVVMTVTLPMRHSR